MKRTLYITAILFLSFPMFFWGQSTDQNYLKKTVYRQPYNWAQVQLGIPQDDMIETVTYYDGLGRPIQTVAQRAGGDREDLIAPSEYDPLGRMPKGWLPLPVTGNPDGEFYEGSGGNDIFDELRIYYKATFPDDFSATGLYPEQYDNPYTNTLYEDSPLDRILEKGAPGTVWRAGTGGTHTIRFGYQTNTTGEVRDFSVTYTGGDYTSPELVYNGHYAQHVLYKSVAKDENWQSSDGNDKTVQEFTDKKGRKLLKRIFNNGTAHDTYYVYDGEGNLVFVLPPEASDQIIDGSSLDADASDILEGLCYRYIYDGRGRLTDKKLPGKEWEYIVYDKLDRPVLTQDRNLRDDGNKWLFTKYDELDRVAYTGILSGFTRAQAQDSLKTSSSLPLSENVDPYGNTIDGTTVYYTNSAFPYSNMKVLTVNYYDDYIDLGGLSAPPSTNYYGTSISTDLQGLPTVSKVRILDGIDDTTPTQYWITTVMGYDNKGRAIYMESENPNFLETEDLVESLLDFTGNVLESRTVHTLTGSSLAVTTLDYYTYDHMGRQLTHQQVIDEDPVQRIAVNHYDELGQLVQKDVGGETFLSGYTDITNTSITYDGDLAKGSASNAWDSGAKTLGEILEDGGVSFTVPQANKVVRVGLKKTTTGGTGWDSYDYAIQLDASGNITLVKNGTYYATVVGTYTTGDSFSVERTGAYIYYKKNGSNIIPALGDLSAATLYGKASLYSGYAEVEDFTLFGTALDKVLQEVDYAHNVRGWLTDINDIEETGWTDTDLFKFRINYKTVEGNSNGTELYNGNIAQTLWKTRNTDTKIRGYNYHYDDLNRIVQARSYEGTSIAAMTTPNDIYTIDNVTYDLNGNIETLLRMGTDDSNSTADAWDNLTYYYEQYTNKLVNVRENSTSGYKDDGFYDGNNQQSTGLDDYLYDDNGNLYVDRNKSISDIEYNHFNLPELVTVTGSGTIDYIYDATGIKYMKIVDDGSTTHTTTYAGNYVYLDGELQFFTHPEGYVTPYAETLGGFGGGGLVYSYFNYVFQYVDHLGNVRLTYSDADKNGAVTVSEIVEESHYYPFGLKQKGYNNSISGGNSLAQQWKYNGTELNEDFSINLYEMDMRQYDPAIARWTTIDPITHHGQSTYAAFDNNPVFWADPSGANGISGTGGFRCDNCSSGVIDGSDIAEGALKGNDSYIGGNGLTETEDSIRKGIYIPSDLGNAEQSTDIQSRPSGNIQNSLLPENGKVSNQQDSVRPDKIDLSRPQKEVLDLIVEWARYIRENNDEKIYLSDIILSKDSSLRDISGALLEMAGGAITPSKTIKDGNGNSLIVNFDRGSLSPNAFTDNSIYGIQFFGRLGNSNRYDIRFLTYFPNQGQFHSILNLNFYGEDFYQEIKQRIQEKRIIKNPDGNSLPFTPIKNKN